MQKHRGLFHLRVYESAEGVAWFASFQRERTYYLPWKYIFPVLSCVTHVIRINEMFKCPKLQKIF